ncbi:MAG: hypothetical protein O3B13_13080 [Planctomycetota bacterium]|nr:hypothetical protein [Planctomycetota bacterium]
MSSLLTTLLIGIWLGQLIPSDSLAVSEREIVSQLSGNGWPLASGQESGPSAALQSPPVTDASALAEAVAEPSINTRIASPELSDEPDVAYFPRAIQGVAGEASVRPVPQHARPVATSTTPLSEEEAAVWNSELQDLPADQAEEILNLRRQLGSVASEAPGLTPSIDSDPDVAPPRLFPLIGEREARPIPLPVSTTSDPELALVSAEPKFKSTIGKKLYSEAIRNFRENSANLKTPGFKRRQIVLLHVSITDSPTAPLHLNEDSQASAGAISPSQPADETDDLAPTAVAEPTAGLKTTSTEPVGWISRLDLSQGELIPTSNPLDFAIEGRGWISVERAGQRLQEFVRTGMLAFDSEGRLGIRSGAGLLLIVPAVRLPTDQYQFILTESGEICIETAASQQQSIAQLVAVEFRDASALKRTPIGTYASTDESGPPIPARPASVRILQSVLEGSNVNRKQELADVDYVQTIVEKIALTE